MIQFELRHVEYTGAPTVSQDGLSLSQRISITTGVVGNTYLEKFIQVDSTVVTTQMSLTANQIKDEITLQATNFVATNYPNIP